jgi:hypothetical protein
MDGPMLILSVMMNACLLRLRYPEYTLDATGNAADDPTDYTAHGSADRTSRTIALLDPFLCTTNDPLSVRCQGHGKNGERQ